MRAPRLRRGDPRGDAVTTTIEAARALVAAGAPVEQAAADLVAAAPDRAVLQDAHLELTRRMHFGPSDDFAATAALRLVQAALALVPHRDGAHADDRGRARRRRSA